MEKRRFLLFFIIMILLPSLMFLTNGVFAADHIDLGDAEIFAVLAGTGITNTGFTTITGDVGSSPTPSETGFPGLVTIIDGMNHTAAAPNDADTQNAKLSLSTAYLNAAGAGPSSPIVGLTLGGGQTLVPGVYNSGSSIQLNGTLTLDGGGDPNAVFIFQAGSTLITASSSEVILTGNASPCNVYWQVGSSATLGTSSTFVGNILAYASITDNGGSTINGSFLANTAAVTLNNTTISRPICAPIVTKSFSPASINEGGISTLTITLTDIIQGIELTSDFTDNLPTGLVIAGTPNLATTCGGTGILTTGLSSVTIPNGYTFPTAGSCTITVDVTSPDAGSYINKIERGDLKTSIGNNISPASATLLVTDEEKASPTITTSTR